MNNKLNLNFEKPINKTITNTDSLTSSLVTDEKSLYDKRLPANFSNVFLKFFSLVGKT